MLSYKLAKQLKEAGFPLREPYCDCSTIWNSPESYEKHLEEMHYPEVAPTLEELIEWCGGEFDSLISMGDSWMACGGPDFKLMGETPSKSMALLGLKLHKHD